MAWLLLAGLAVAVVLRFARRRSAMVKVSPTASISTLHVGMSRRQSAKTKAALEAATGALRH